MFIRFRVLVPGVAQVISVFDAVGVLRLLRAGWGCILVPPHRDIGEEPAGVPLRPRNRRADDHSGQPVERFDTLSGAVDQSGGM